jgi:tRNA(Ile)-lysidine synthase
MEVVEAVHRFLKQQQESPCHLAVAVSGGPDSTALLLALAELRPHGYQLTAVHVNHHLRGEASDLDEQFVRQLCSAHDIPLLVAEGQLDPQQIREGGVEAAAREVRYRELQRMRERAGARFLVTAHHREDQAETVMMRILTGSGIERLAGIAPVTSTGILRPLLDVSRRDLADYLRNHGVEPRADSMNADVRFLRNKIRHELLPVLAQQNPRIVEHLAGLAQQVRERAVAFELLFADASAGWVRRTATTSQFDLGTLPADPWMRRSLLWREIRRLAPEARDISATDLERLASSLPSLRRVSVTKRLELARTGQTVTLGLAVSRGAAVERGIRPGSSVRVDGTLVRLERRGAAAPPYTDSARTFQLFQLPADAPGEAFMVRTRRRGERFQPLGLHQEKKLNEFLIDRKIPREHRDHIPLLTWHDEIVWIAGVEVSEKFKVAEPWREAYRVSIERRNRQAPVQR